MGNFKIVNRVITEYAGDDECVVIPKGAHSLGDLVFCGNAVKRVVISETIKNIGYRAFADCTELTEIVLTGNITEIGAEAFWGCTALKEIKIPDGVELIGDGAFKGCCFLEKIDVSDTVTEIGNEAFTGCSALKEIKIPDGVYSVGDGAFSGCIALTEITLPEYINVVGNDTFHGCSSLRKAELLGRVKSISDGAFAGCSNLVNIRIPTSIESVKPYAFADCTSLKEITLSNTEGGECSVEMASFHNCASLERIVLSKGVTMIEAFAFEGCKAIRYLELSEDLRFMATSAFVKFTDKITVVTPDLNRVVDWMRGVERYMLSIEKAKDLTFGAIRGFAERYLRGEVSEEENEKWCAKIKEWNDKGKLDFVSGVDLSFSNEPAVLEYATANGVFSMEQAEGILKQTTDLHCRVILVKYIDWFYKKRSSKQLSEDTKGIRSWLGLISRRAY